MQFNVLIVEDDLFAARFLQNIIESNCAFKVTGIERSKKGALKVFSEKKIDTVFIDVMLNGKAAGSKLAVEIAKKYPDTAIVFASAYSKKEMIEDAAEANAFAYLLKPYRFEEIEAVLEFLKERLKNRIEKSHKLQLIEGYYFDYSNGCLCKGDKKIYLRKQELALVKLLAGKHSTVMARETILNCLNISNDALRALIYRIRNATTKDLIQSHKRFGYKLAVI